MEYLRNNPITVVILFTIAIVALLFSIYWTFLRGSPPASPDKRSPAPQVTPSDAPQGQGSGGQQVPY